MDSVGRLAGGVAHDMNNMLSVIMGYASIAMLKLPESDPMRDIFSKIHHAGQRSAEVTNKLLAFARKQTISPEVLDLNEALQGMLSMLQRLLGEDIDLAWKPKANLKAIKIDPSQLDQILMNLCVNARDAIAGVGHLTIETGMTSFDATYCAQNPGFRPVKYTMLAVSDNGCGIDAETLEQIFEPFFSTKAPGQGTGLGLATVYGIVKQNNGFIKVYSEVDQGTTFKIYFPQHQAEPMQDKKVAQTSALLGQGQKILIVEDDPAIRNVIETILVESKYQVLTTGVPHEALQIAEQEGDIDLLITDVVMPEMNGKQLTEFMLEKNRKIKVIYMSGYTANVISHHGVLDEGVNFIEKPITFEKLVNKVGEVLNQPEMD